MKKKGNTILILLTKPYKDWIIQAIEDEIKRTGLSQNKIILEAIADKVGKKKKKQE